MTQEEILRSRLSSAAELMKEWAEESDKDEKLFEKVDERISNWHHGRAQAYRLASDWIMEILHEEN